MKIKIEIANSFIDFLQFFPILNFFEIIHINQNNIPELNVSEKVTSNIQIVCNYLKNMNVINQKDIFFPGLFEKDSPLHNAIEARALSQDEWCFFP